MPAREGEQLIRCQRSSKIASMDLTTIYAANRSRSRLSAIVMMAIIDGLFATVIAAVLCLGFAECAYAYVDPSVMTYTIQALAGVAVAMSAVISVFWRRVRRFAMKLLNIDENHGKTVDPPVHRIGDPEYGSVLVLNGKSASPSGLSGVSENAQDSVARWPRRFLIALLTSFTLLFTVFFVAPIELVYGGSEDITFNVLDVLPLLATFTIICGAAIALLVSVLKGRFYRMAIAVIASCSLCCFLQSLVMNGGLPLADGSAVDWSNFAFSALWNIVVWVAIFVAICYFCSKRAAVGRVAVCAIAIVLLLVQGLSAGVIVAREIRHPEFMITQEGLFEVSQNENVIVFLLDTVDTNEFDDLIAEHPDVLDGFDGFTLFEDSASTMIPTAYAVPFLTTGEHIQDDETLMNYRDTRFARSSFLQDIADANYSISIYADCMYSGVETFSDIVLNFDEHKKVPINPFSALGTLGKAALYRDVPWIAKPFFWFYTGDFNAQVVDQTVDVPFEEKPYVLDDPAFSIALEKNGLSFAEDESSDGAFKFIHLTGSHVPYIMDEQANYVPSGTSLEAQTIGAFSIVRDYLDRLRELGKYDDATILILADHGVWGGSTDENGRLMMATTPLCLVKPAYEQGEVPVGVSVSMNPVSQDDFHATVLEAMGVDGASYGATYFDEEDSDRIRYHYQLVPSEEGDKEVYQFEIKGDARNWENWEPTGKDWPGDE